MTELRGNTPKYNDPTTRSILQQFRMNHDLPILSNITFDLSTVPNDESFTPCKRQT